RAVARVAARCGAGSLPPWRSRVRKLGPIALCGVVLSAVAVACGAGSDRSGKDPNVNAVTTERCLVRLHGKGDRGAETVVKDGVSVVSPDGNAAGWGGRQWLYF